MPHLPPLGHKGGGKLGALSRVSACDVVCIIYDFSNQFGGGVVAVGMTLICAYKPHPRSVCGDETIPTAANSITS